MHNAIQLPRGSPCDNGTATGVFVQGHYHLICWQENAWRDLDAIEEGKLFLENAKKCSRR